MPTRNCADFPAPGCVDLIPEIWSATVPPCGAIAGAGLSARDVAGIGITGGAFTVIWDRALRRSIYRSSAGPPHGGLYASAALAEAKSQPDPGSCSALCCRQGAWLLEHVEGACQSRSRQACIRNHRRFSVAAGWRQGHATDASVPRTLLLDTAGGRGMITVQDVRRPANLLPCRADCAGEFGTTTEDLFGSTIRILGIAGDQQAQSGRVASSQNDGIDI
jgi:glycerol kinase